MLQLIIGVFLGVILLFVIVLLLTEITSTYPVWKHFSNKSLLYANRLPAAKARKQNRLRLFLLLMGCLLGIAAVAFFAGKLLFATRATAAKEANVKSRLPVAPVNRHLTAIATDDGLLFTLQTKWEDGKIYGNNKVLFQKAPITNFSDWLYLLLDKDGFLLKEFHFSPTEFIVETAADGRVTALLNRFNAAMTQKEYLRIDRLQVVVDKKVKMNPLN